MDKNFIKGTIYVFGSAIAFGIMPILAKLAYIGGATAFTVVFLRFFFATIMIGYYLLKKHISFKLKSNQYIILSVLGVFGYATTSSTLFMAYNYISLGMATMLHFTYPVIVTVLSVLFGKETVTKRIVVSLLLSVLGMALLIEIGNITLDYRGIAFALSSAVFYSFYIIGTSHSSIRNIDSFIMTFYISLSSSIIILAVGYFLNNINLHISFYSLVSILLISFISTVIALKAFIEGVKLIGPTKAAILSTFEPIVSMLLGIIIFNEMLNYKQVMGSILLITSIFVITIKKVNNKKYPA